MLGIADSVIGVAGKVLDKFVEDKDLKTKLEAELKQQVVSSGSCPGSGECRERETLQRVRRRG